MMSHRIKKYKNTDNLFYIQKEMINFVAISCNYEVKS